MSEHIEQLHKGDKLSPSEIQNLLIESEEHLSKDSEQRILALGQDAVAPLLTVLENHALLQVDAPGLGNAPIHAVDLLQKLGAKEAIRPMIDLLLDSDPLDTIFSQVCFALESFGEAAAAEILAEVETTKNSEGRGYLLTVLVGCGVCDERVFQLLLKRLKEDPEMGASNLGMYGDSRALEPLQRALDNYQLTPDPSAFSDHAVIDLACAIEQLGGTLSETQRLKRQRVRSYPWLATETTGLRRDAVTHRKIGRNAPCPCGSGKKYKKCCG